MALPLVIQDRWEGARLPLGVTDGRKQGALTSVNVNVALVPSTALSSVFPNSSCPSPPGIEKEGVEHSCHCGNSLLTILGDHLAVSSGNLAGQ